MKYSHYSTTAITLHWLIALLIIGMLVSGFVMTNVDMSDHPKTLRNLYTMHKSTGILILLLSLFRLFWRLTHKPPPLPQSMAGWEKICSKILHWAFYVLIIMIPFSGWAMSSAGGHKISFFGMFTWPFLPGFDMLASGDKDDVGDLFYTIHVRLNYGLIALLLLHILAALKHLLWDRDEVVYRMTLWFKPKSLKD